MSDENVESFEKELKSLDIKYYDFNQFEVLETIGNGGFATVYQAKLIDSNLSTEYVALKKFFRENDEATYRTILKEKNQDLGWSDKLNLAQQLAEAVMHMHSANIVHRDLHSNNILIHKNNIKIADFGLSRCLADATNTKTGILGYPPYMDPNSFEHFEQETYKIKKESDIYSLGVLLWEISSLRPPFDKYKDIAAALCLKILDGTREAPIDGEPVVIGSCKELGNWEMIKFTQPYEQYPAYWRSPPVEIQLIGGNEIMYNYGIFDQKKISIENEEDGEIQKRTLDIRTNDQYDIWQNNRNHHIVLDPKEFAFIKCIYDTVNIENLKYKVMQFQLLLENHRDLVLNHTTIDFITQHCQSERDKRLFLCVILGYYVKHCKDLDTLQLPQNFRSDLLLEALEDFQEDTFTSDIQPIMVSVVAALVHHNATVRISFEWLSIFRVAQSLDPKYTFVDGFIVARYDEEDTLRLLTKWPKVVDPYLAQIDEYIYIKIAKWLISLCSNIEKLSSTMSPEVLELCRQWFTRIVTKLSYHNGLSLNDGGRFICSIYEHLTGLQHLFIVTSKIYQELLHIANELIKKCSNKHILFATVQVAKFSESTIKQFSNLVIENVLVAKDIRIIDKSLMEMVYWICGQSYVPNLEILDVPNSISENLLCHILTCLENQTSQIYTDFWRIIFNARGSVTNLHKHSCVMKIRTAISDLANSIVDKTIDIKTLQAILSKNSVEHLYKCLNVANNNNIKETFQSVIITESNISNVRKEYKAFEEIFRHLKAFYSTFCPPSKVSDSDQYTGDLERKLRILSKVPLKETLSPRYWEHHEDVIQKAADIYRLANSKTFTNIYEIQLSQLTDKINVNYVANTLIPAVREEHHKIFKKYEDRKWEHIKYSEAFPLWKSVTNIKTELELINQAVYLSKSNQDLEISLNHLTAISKWDERLQKLSTVVDIFKVPLKTEDWLGRCLKILREDELILGKVVEFVKNVEEHNPADNENYWSFIKELSSTIAEHDIMNLVDYLDEYSDKQLIENDTVSSLIQLKQLVVQLMNGSKKMDEFLKVLQNISQALPIKLQEYIGFNMALQNMLRNISYIEEVTKEKIQNAVLRGTYTFEKDDKSDKFNVSLVYQARGAADKIKHNMSNLLNLRGRALLITKPANINSDLTEGEDSRKIMSEFVLQVDIAQKILNVGSNLIQIGHFDYRRFEEIIGTEKSVETPEMIALLENLKVDLQNWKKAVDEAQDHHYYLTFFPARHILAFYDYFTSDVQDNENTEICRALIKFVNSEAELPSQKDHSGISRENTDYSYTLKEIGEKLNVIFGNLLKTPRELKVRGEHIISDVVDRGKLFVASCNDKLCIPNIIMSLYASNGFYPEPWQILICTKSTTIEELNIFIIRCFFAAKNGYRENLFCIANLELLELVLQISLVEIIKSMCDKHNDYLLALVYHHKVPFHHHILDQFSQDVHLTNGLNAEIMKAIYHDLCSNVTCVSSDLPGQGKTEWIKQASLKKKKGLHSFLISDSSNYESLVCQLKDRKIHPTESLHINIMSAENPNEINLFLFELLTLGFVSNNIYIISLPRIPIFIEVATTVNQELLNSLPIASYLIKEHLSWSIRNLNVSSEICDPIQIVCNYLDAHEKHEINERDIIFHGQGFITKPLSDKRCQDLIVKYFLEGNTDNITSFRFIEIFTNVLADQLFRLSSNTCLTVENLKLLINEKTLRTTLVELLIEVSKEFATRSVKTKAAQLESTCDDYEAKFKIAQWDVSSHLLVCFMSQNPDLICALYRQKKTVPENVKEFLKIQSMTDPDKWELKYYSQIPPKLLLEMLKCLARRPAYEIDLPSYRNALSADNLARRTAYEIDLPSYRYALSADNLVKMALILLRTRANVPIVIMGEAGCGKSSLIGFLAKVAEVNYEPFNLHAGIKEQDILDFMNKAQKKADNGELWLFFDEINTCNHTGLLANIITHRAFDGKLLHPNIKLLSACNPYRKRIKSQNQAGIKTKVKKYEDQSNLVYQVKPLPDQILDYVWDYGVLFSKDEKRYIRLMVQTRFSEGQELFTKLLIASQQFIRLIEENYSVSLRDVKRAIKLVSFFEESLQTRSNSEYSGGNKNYPPPDGSSRISLQIRSYILALSLCYQSRIYDQESRSGYRQAMINVFQRYKMNVEESEFTRVIRDEQEDWFKRMQLPPETVMNEALLENVLVVIVCILTKIPTFIIGTPGSSKSLAIKLVRLNLRGSDSNDKYFRKLPQVYLISYQGSSSSTSDGIIKVFDKAIKYQETSSKEFSVISVVVFDGIGLAENNSHKPLKVLHALLEPNYPSDGPAVSFVGISNWRLDISKSSRALLVQRPKFGIEDLIDTAVRLFDFKLQESMTRNSLRPLAEAYSEYEGCDVSEEFLIDKIISEDNATQLDQWQHEVVKILSFSAKILKTNKLRSYQLLCICNDIISSKLLQLPNIKEIIKLGEWRALDRHASEYLEAVYKLNNLSNGYKQTIRRILLNNQSLLRLDNTIDNNNLYLKSVIAHIIAMHASIPPDSTPLATYFHKIEACQDMFTLTTVSDVESPILNNSPITEPIKFEDQPGYIGEQVNKAFGHSVRSMPPSSYRILHLIVHTLIGSSAHSQATLNFLHRHNQIANNTEQYCLAHINADWTVLKQILDCSDESLALLFHSLLTTMTETLLPASMLRTPAEREDWEMHFTRNYVSPLIRSVIEKATNFRAALAAAAEDQEMGTSTSIIVTPRTLKQACIDNIISYNQEEFREIHEIEKIIDFETKQPATIINGKVMKFSAEVFATALRRFIYRFLQGQKQKETDPLCLYICDSSLHFWPPVISELEDLKEPFPESLYVNQAFEAYKYITEQIEILYTDPAAPISQRGSPPKRKQKPRHNDVF
ncbi:15158_t:CDS:10 [Dentiscutata erythropus]|uniref:15158_t:CDS:1 n=1 Tax=Dentiscutata erythropus TaxID=1348616 RepID=A0A9N8ZQ22_9GLOM|nr:15158_t:CDS:10 [Dentiscutata erythropus]